MRRSPRALSPSSDRWMLLSWQPGLVLENSKTRPCWWPHLGWCQIYQKSLWRILELADRSDWRRKSLRWVTLSSSCLEILCPVNRRYQILGKLNPRCNFALGLWSRKRRGRIGLLRSIAGCKEKESFVLVRRGWGVSAWASKIEKILRWWICSWSGSWESFPDLCKI